VRYSYHLTPVPAPIISSRGFHHTISPAPHLPRLPQKQKLRLTAPRTSGLIPPPLRLALRQRFLTGSCGSGASGGSGGGSAEHFRGWCEARHRRCLFRFGSPFYFHHRFSFSLGRLRVWRGWGGRDLYSWCCLRRGGFLRSLFGCRLFWRGFLRALLRWGRFLQSLSRRLRNRLQRRGRHFLERI
jgi:hypothetical protein